MGKEVIKVVTDKKSDCAVTCVPKSNSDRANDLSSKPSTIAESNKAINGTQGDENSHQGQEVPCLRNVSLGEDAAENKHSTQKSSNQKKSAASKPDNTGNARSNLTVPQPFTLATTKRASGGNRVFVAEATGSVDKPARVDDPHSANIIRNAQSNSPLMFGKPLKPGNIMHPDTEDSFSVSSTAASVRNLKGRTIVTIAPTFRCSERAEKRKEFYSKLEQKHQALAAEKIQSEARMREEQEAALKELRKSLTFKANPMPSFYNEGPPPKVELKKVPPTRAKSPKFTRRKSYSDVNPAEGDNCGGVCGRLRRHSLGTPMEAAKRLQNSPKNVKGKGPKSNRESSKPVAIKRTNQTTTGVTVQA